MILNQQTGTLDTSRGVWTIEAKHARPGGDVDVILSFRPVGTSDRTHFGFRRGDYWTQLVGAWTHRYQAIPAVAAEMRTQVLTYRALIPLLDLAVAMEDFPDAVEAAEAS